MQITDVIVWRITACDTIALPAWEERLPSPLDHLPERATAGPAGDPVEAVPGRAEIEQLFVEIATDAGVSGWYGPVNADAAGLVQRALAPFLRGRDPLPVAELWDEMMRASYGGRSGDWPYAVGAVDLALWDLRGRVLGQPVCKLLGGPTRTAVTCGVAAVGSSLRPEAVVRRAGAWQRQGFRSQKWFPRHGVGHGAAGLRANRDLVALLRRTLGADDGIVLDALASWSLGFAVEQLAMLAEFAPRWIEEPLPVHDLAGYRQLRRRSSVPIAVGEHLFTQAEALPFLQEGLCDYLQVDVAWCGGLTGAMRQAHLAEAFGLKVAPHAGDRLATLHFCAALPQALVPEVCWVPFVGLRERLALTWRGQPVDGALAVPDAPGLGLELDPARVVRRERAA